MHKIMLNKQEKQWILEQRLLRLTDNKECLVYPMGAERYLSSVLSGQKTSPYNIKEDIVGKDVLLVPGYGNTCFLFAEAGAKSITVYDKDPVTIAWLKAFKLYYNYREKNHYPSIGDILAALTRWYPPIVKLPSGKFRNILMYAFDPQSLRRCYFFYMISLVRHAIESKVRGDFALAHDIEFHAGEVSIAFKNKINPVFDTAYVPYLLGVLNGIEKEDEIVAFIHQLTQLVPKGRILISPSRNTKEFYVLGKRYFVTTAYSSIEEVPELAKYVIDNDVNWYKTQGLAVLGLSMV